MQFWRTVKPLLPEKNQVKWENHFSWRWNSSTQDEQNAELLNIFFSNAVKNLKKPKFKYKNHPSIVAIRNENNNSHFHFNEVSVEDVYKEIRKSSPRKSA